VRAAGWLFVAGTVCFSGSLYLLSLTGARWLGAVTPLGGLLFIAGGWRSPRAYWRADGGLPPVRTRDLPLFYTQGTAANTTSTVAPPAAW